MRGQGKPVRIREGMAGRKLKESKGKTCTVSLGEQKDKEFQVFHITDDSEDVLPCYSTNATVSQKAHVYTCFLFEIWPTPTISYLIKRVFLYHPKTFCFFLLL